MSTPYSSAGKSFKDLKQAQKARITDYMYLETQNFVSANGRIPVSVEDCETIVQKVCGHINIQISFDEVYKEYRKKRLHIIERLKATAYRSIIPTNRGAWQIGWTSKQSSIF